MDIARHIVLPACLMLMLASNLLAERAFGLDGRAMYNAFPTAFTPAPYTFAIWGLIFVGCIALTIQMGFRPTGSEARLDFLAWCVALAFFLTRPRLSRRSASATSCSAR
jgi:hypothetical protein